MELDREKLLELYPDYTSVLGPYTRKDNRQHVVLNNSNASKGTKGKTKTISYPKALVESNRGTKLLNNETIDHDNRIVSCNENDNLIIRDRENHSYLDALRVDVVAVECPVCQQEFIPSKDQRNSSNRAGPFCSRTCSGKYGKSVQNGNSKLPRTQLIKDYSRIDK